ncbi:hypothetical protein [Nocardioides campestrisoli]|uniref:hypothetical protein n=1 Tax=Nocardioides campestrisoli TaxID=2736757 RepID=UPI00163D978F|nr:hypothetical protein [Nocardioides campestrisoli]
MGSGLRVVRWAVAAFVAVALFLAIGIVFDRGVGPLLAKDECVAEVDGHTVRLSPEQAENAALIAAVAERRGLPARAVSIALATAYQESKILNIEHGDRDSLGLFQQRPSQGWGTPEQVLDPYFAANAFYDALEKVGDYRTLEITVAAQEVQRSAYPDAYADHEADARVLASALTGNSPEAFTCTGQDVPDTAPAALTETGLTERADRVRRELELAFGPQSLGGFAPGGVGDGHMAGSAHYAGRAVDVFFRPVNQENRRRGWAVAHYLVAHASRLDVQTVIFDDRIWQARRADDGWRDYRVPRSSSGDREILEHRDHVHVDVFE